MHYDTFVSCDPGLSGALCVLSPMGVELFDIPTFKKKVGKRNKRIIDEEELFIIINDIVDNAPPDSTIAVIENVHSSPQMGVTSAFSMGYGLGLVRSALQMRALKLESMTPQTWKKYFDLIGCDKSASIDKAKELYPEADITLKKHDGRAEALLMANWLLETIDKPPH